jgi:hypothetical protein
MVVCVCVFGQETQTSGGFQYIIEGTGTGRTITITGYTGSDSIVTIPAAINNIPVTVIGDEVFRRSNVAEVSLPDTIVSIGYGAFYWSNLRKINIPKNLTEIEYGAFGHPYGEIIRNMRETDAGIVQTLIATFGDYIFQSLQ